MSRKEYSWFLKTDYAPSSTTQQQTQDNSAENFKRANKVLASDSEPVHIWNFSGRTTFILMNEWNRMPQDPQPSDQEMKTLSLQLMQLLSDSRSLMVLPSSAIWITLVWKGEHPVTVTPW
ncbi:uncharacterized protein [Triticum aestivum]|uniref:UBP8/5-like ubiquitin-like domain-containing protein n=1 Tax=Triticum turgidum subsp. durum TaxID=4567 RepID=A0A9R1B9I2_TRITD|nr:uncharacterized protein LOC123136682 isoform X2 [Triticum aestivum]VAI56467.1 unnamed protein product [Triticum turgidum subsp. durum]